MVYEPICSQRGELINLVFLVILYFLFDVMQRNYWDISLCASFDIDQLKNISTMTIFYFKFFKILNSQLKGLISRYLSYLEYSYPILFDPIPNSVYLKNRIIHT